MKKEKVKNEAKIILITGSPAAGKFTVGKKLSKELGVPLLHNHMVIDLVKELFPNEENKHKLREPLFFYLLSFAAKQGHSLILTYAYAQNYTSKSGINDVDLVKKIKRVSKSNGGIFYSIHLQTSEKEILARTIKPSRKKYHKLKDVKEMKNILKQWDVVTPPPFKDGVVINNSKLSADKTVKLILQKIDN
jgi:shikimate kinase